MNEDSLTDKAGNGEEKNPVPAEVDLEDKNHFIDQKQIICFYLNHELFGIYIDFVEEIVRLRDMTRIPHTPPYLKGVLNLRGRIIPVTDLQIHFDLDHKDYDEYSRIIILKIADNPVGIIVNSVTEVLKLPTDRIDHVPEFASEKLNVDVKFFTGIGKVDESHIVIILNPNEILSSNYFI